MHSTATLTTPSPRHQARKDTSKHRPCKGTKSVYVSQAHRPFALTNTPSQRPNSLRKPHKQTPLPQTKQITNTHMHQQNQPTARSALERPSNNQRLHRLRSRTYRRACKEHCKCSQYDGSAPPDIRQFCPYGSGRCVCEEKCAADPGISCCGVEVPRYGGCGCCDDGGVEGGDEEG